jgi:hypothetical protein
LIGSRGKFKLKAQPQFDRSRADESLIIINVFGKPPQEGDTVDRTAVERLLVFSQMTEAGIL